MSELKTISTSGIRENPVALRNVDRQSEDYLGIVQSMRERGFFGAITVREKLDAETGVSFYELVDGLHRFTAAKDAGIDMINVDVVSLTEDQVMEVQIMANIHKVETKPVEYSKQLMRLLTRNPLMTESELATKLGKSSQWIKDRLGLNKIGSEDIAKLIDSGEINLSNAYALAKLPPEEMADFLDRAITLPPDEFVPAVNARVKEIKEAKRQGKDPNAQAFQPVAHMQKLGDLKSEMETGEIGKVLCQECGAKTPLDGFALGVKWSLHMDPKSIEIQKGKDEERKKEREEAKQKREAEKADKKAVEAKKKAEEAAIAAEKAKEALVPAAK